MTEMESMVGLTPLEEKRRVTFSFSDIVYVVPVKKGKTKVNKQILHKLSGQVLAGQCMAVMGPSGAGKTSLLDILSSRVNQTEGKILVNGSHLSSTQFRRLAAYVPQNDYFRGSLTVRETMILYANLRLSSNQFTQQQKIDKAEQIIRELRLSSCVDTLIGTDILKGVSGGELRRVGIGVELITDPPIIFLDEPTSGLDSATAYSIMKTILSLSVSGRTVICTIHQPPSNVFNAFDQLYLLGNGHTLYYGPAQGVIHHFERIGFLCPAYTNPADFIMEVVTNYDRDDTDDERMEKLIQGYKIAEGEKEKEKIVELSEEEAEKYEKMSMATTWFEQVVILAGVVWKNSIRDPLATRLKIVQALANGLLIGVLFFGLGHNQADLRSRLGVIAFSLVGGIFMPVGMMIQIFPRLQAVFLRDRRSETYYTSSFYLSYVIAELPFAFLAPILQATLTYWLSNLNNDPDRYFIYLLFFSMLGISASALGISISAVSPHPEVGSALGPLVVVFFVVFSGFFLNLNSVPSYLEWAPETSIMKWSLQSLVWNEFHDVEFYCTESEMPEGENATCPYTNGNQYIDDLSFGDTDLVENFFIVLALYLIFHLVGVFSLHWKSKKK